jgi:uncharacterized protein YecT (DUF1311 family)
MRISIYIRRIATLLLFLLVQTACGWVQNTQSATAPPMRSTTEITRVTANALVLTPEPRIFVQFSPQQAYCWNLAVSQPTLAQTDVMKCAEADLELRVSMLRNLLLEIKNQSKNTRTPGAPERPADFNEKFDLADTAWQTWRDSDCAVETALYFGSSAAPMVKVSCQATHTYHRIMRLRLFLCEDLGQNGICPAARRYE